MNTQLIQDPDMIKEIEPTIWKKYQYSDCPFIFRLDGKTIVYGEAEFEQSEVYIKMMESIEKKKGYGRLFIEHLKSLPTIKEIWGEAIEDAVPFWYKIGAKLHPTEFERFINQDELEEDFLLPFSIKCS